MNVNSGNEAAVRGNAPWAAAFVIGYNNYFKCSSACCDELYKTYKMQGNVW